MPLFRYELRCRYAMPRCFIAFIFRPPDIRSTLITIRVTADMPAARHAPMLRDIITIITPCHAVIF